MSHAHETEESRILDRTDFLVLSGPVSFLDVYTHGVSMLL
jgi:hypothetical protein